MNDKVAVFQRLIDELTGLEFPAWKFFCNQIANLENIAFKCAHPLPADLFAAPDDSKGSEPLRAGVRGRCNRSLHDELRAISIKARREARPSKDRSV